MRREFRVSVEVQASRPQAWNALLDDPSRMVASAARVAARRLTASAGAIQLGSPWPARVTVEVGGPSSCPVCDRIPIRWSAPGSVVPSADAVLELRDAGTRTAVVLDGGYELSLAAAGSWGDAGEPAGVALATLQVLAAEVAREIELELARRIAVWQAGPLLDSALV